MLNPPISRMGGKSKLRKHIIEIMPEHNCSLEQAGFTLVKISQR